MRDKLILQDGLTLVPYFRCDFREPWGNRIQVGDLLDDAIVQFLPKFLVCHFALKHFGLYA
ncbi:MAG: hypothetical protein OEW33_16615 [Nitrospirota bacterium]|nr:hypothetical protein [Nitrospirota bacterium]